MAADFARARLACALPPIVHVVLNTRFQTIRAIRADRLAGPFVTASVILCLNALVETDLVVQPIYLACVVYAVFRGGIGSGLTSSAIIITDALLRGVAVPFGLDEPLREVKIVALACLVLVLVTGHLKRRADRATELSQTNDELAGQLIERIRSEEAAMALAAMTRDIVEPLEPSRVHHRIVTTILQLARARHAMLYWMDAASQELVCVAIAGLAGETWLGRRMPAGDGLGGRAIREQRVLCVRDAVLSDGSGATVAVPLRARGKVLGVLTFEVDAEKKIAETDLQLLSIFAGHAALALENAQLYEELRAALDKLSESQSRLVDDARLRATEEVAAGVAHHVNNRLMVILTGIQLLMSKLTGEEHRRSLEIVERATLNTAWLIERLRQFALGRPRDAVESADLDLAARRVVEICRVDVADAQTRGATVALELRLGSVPRVVADEAGLEEALAHIVRNAIEAVAAHGTVTITTWAAGNGVLCSVADTGAGMPADVTQRAVEPFFTTKGPQRAGLGLSSALGIMRQMGGHLEIESRVEIGTRVTVRLRPHVS
jgi:signal transduction histidine kinase